MPILHKYNFSKLLKCTDLLLKSEEAWKKGTKTTKHSFGEWLWLADELQMVSLHTTLATLLQDMVSPADTVRLFVIGQEVNAAAVRMHGPDFGFTQGLVGSLVDLHPQTNWQHGPQVNACLHCPFAPRFGILALNAEWQCYWPFWQL
eukprot:gene7439-577_t